MAQSKTTPPARQPDLFTEARRVYNARKRLIAKADKLMTDASDAVRSIVESIEESEAARVIEVANQVRGPSSIDHDPPI